MAIEQLRTIALLALVGIMFLMWQAWQQDYGPKAPTQATPPTAQAPVPVAPDVPGSPAAPAGPPGAPAVPGAEPVAVSDTDVARVRTDLLAAEIDLKGGTLRRLDLLAYPVSLEKPDTPFTLLSPTLPDLFIAQSGLVGQAAAPDHHAQFVVSQPDFALADGVDTVEVPLRWEGSDGVVVTKIYRFHRDSYVVDVSYRIDNNGADPWQGNMYGQFQRTEVAQKERLNFVYTYTGGVISTPEKRYQKIAFDDMQSEDLNVSVEGGWVAMIQHYFAGAWIPPSGGTNHYYTKSLGQNRYVIGAITPPTTVAPGESGVLGMSTYIGPKTQERMEKAAPGLELTVDYGVLTIIAQPVFWLLKWVHGVVGNWGWAIVIITILIKAAFFHLSATSYKSMARMRKLQPRLIALRERYGNDKARLNQAMMELYKTEKVNPLGGCLPILVQIPVFIALYWVLLESVELRQAPFVFWLKDLSTYDPYFVLPILMGVTMIIQQRLNPAPPDPIQAKIMMALPFVFTFFFLFFPSGLVLYWFVNNVLSIAQQWVITRRMLEGTKA